MKSDPIKSTESGGKAASEPVGMLATEKVSLRESSESFKPIHREFPGPRNADVALRVAFERRASADLIGHAKESLEVEVCGVLAGEVCEDNEGPFVHVLAAIRGTAASEASTHVTFTQATWNSIHKTLERDYPKLRIVGWYHTHPGFGVEFSDMDLFIQKNFFSGPTQIALVTDPLSGSVAICLNTPKGVRYLSRYWVDGREQPCRVPEAKGQVAATASPAGATESARSEIAQIEARLGQLVQAIDEQRSWQHNFMLFCGFVFCLAIIGAMGYFIYKTYTSRLEPPQLNTSFIPVPIQLGEKRILVGLGVVEWNVPDELNAILVQEDLLRKEAAEKEARKLEKEGKAATNSPAATNAPKASPTVSTNK